jgi:DNA modification methylase
MAIKYEITHEQSSQLERLNAINWDFCGAKTSYLTHGIHPYPAKYIPQIPKALIQELSSVGETVADIFCGSGTTLVEALTLKRHAIGVDANPLACLISEAKTTRFKKEDEELLNFIVKRARILADSISIQNEGLFLNLNPFISSAPRPLDKAISFWFEPFVVEELAEILSWCRKLPTQSSRKVALAAFSSIIVSVSKQDSDTRYVRRQKNLSPGEVLRRFARSLTEAIRAVAEFTELVEPSSHCRIYNANILTKPDIGEVDLIVCSPPYPNAYSYHLYHMTRMLWLEMDQPKFKREEIGSHRKYSSKGSNGATVETFRNEMATIFDWLSHHLQNSRYACFVVGDSTINGEEVSNADLISGIASAYGFNEVNRIYRHMQDTKKAFNPVIGKIGSDPMRR